MPKKNGSSMTKDQFETLRIMLAKYDQQHIRNLVKRKRNIDRIYDQLCKEAAWLGKHTQFDDPDDPFYFSDFPETQKMIDNLIADYADKMQILIEKGNEEEWLLSAQKNASMIEMITKGSKIPEATVKAWKQPHLDALAAFQQRKLGDGMGLSERVWNLSQQVKGELELALDLGLGEGKSAADLSRDVRKYLDKPNKLFRRVRDKHGALRLSKNAAAYHPGRGVYRSSYKNAIRMTGTENNMAYRTADHDKWGRLDFVIGIEIHLSNNHTLNGKTFHDICDEMQGKYPKDFKFTGWHPQCRCFATPILADWEEQLKVMDMQDAGKDTSNYHYKGEVTEMPEGYNKWMKDNAERIANAKSLPYFVSDNIKYAEKATGFTYVQNAKGENSLLGRAVSAVLEKKSFEHPLPAEVDVMLKEYLQDRKGLINTNYKLCTRNMGKYGASASTEIRQDAKGKDYHVITISSATQEATIKGRKVKYNPLKEVTKGLQNIKEGKELTFTQEYSLETVWHEIWHAGAYKWADETKGIGTYYRTPMECINQFCARKSYGSFIAGLGGKARWQEEIMKNGLSYSTELSNFNSMLEKCGISRDSAYEYFKGKIKSYPYENIRGEMIKFFNSNKKAPIGYYGELIDALSLNPQKFNILMGG